MTKQELYNQLLDVYEAVTPVSEWVNFNSIEDFNAYQIKTYKDGQGFVTHIAYVKHEGSVNESIYFSAVDLLTNPPKSFNQRLMDLIEAKTLDGTIVTAIPVAIGNKSAEVYVYRMVTTTLVKEAWLVYLDNSDVIQLKKIG